MKICTLIYYVHPIVSHTFAEQDTLHTGVYIYAPIFFFLQIWVPEMIMGIMLSG